MLDQKFENKSSSECLQWAARLYHPIISWSPTTLPLTFLIVKFMARSIPAEGSGPINIINHPNFSAAHVELVLVLFGGLTCAMPRPRYGHFPAASLTSHQGCSSLLRVCQITTKNWHWSPALAGLGLSDHRNCFHSKVWHVIFNRHSAPFLLISAIFFKHWAKTTHKWG